jgi:hypothetical protein
MNTLRTHVKNFTGLLKKAAHDQTNLDEGFTAFVENVGQAYIESSDYDAVEANAAERLSTRAAKKAAKPVRLDENGNEIKPKRGRPVGSKNKPKVPVEAPPAVPSTPAAFVPAVTVTEEA